MKTLIIGILALGTTAGYAQTLTKAQFASLLQSKKATLEKVNVGMSKTMVTTSTVTLEDGSKCDFKQTAIQSILKFEAEKMVVVSKETFQPAATAACRAGGLEAFEETILFYEAKPNLSKDLEDLNESDVKSISRADDIVTMTVAGTIEGSTETELLTVKYDLNKSSFKNMLLSQSPSFKIETSEAADIDVNAVNLTDVVFCENNDGAKEDCVRGDFSDILF